VPAVVKLVLVPFTQALVKGPEVPVDQRAEVQSPVEVVVVFWALAVWLISNAAARTAGTTTSRLNPEQIHRPRDGFAPEAIVPPVQSGPA
jgi:hypothetical protein